MEVCQKKLSFDFVFTIFWCQICDLPFEFFDMDSITTWKVIFFVALEWNQEFEVSYVVLPCSFHTLFYIFHIFFYIFLICCVFSVLLRTSGGGIGLLFLITFTILSLDHSQHLGTFSKFFLPRQSKSVSP